MTPFARSLWRCTQSSEKSNQRRESTHRRSGGNRQGIPPLGCTGPRSPFLVADDLAFDPIFRKKCVMGRWTTKKLRLCYRGPLCAIIKTGHQSVLHSNNFFAIPRTFRLSNSETGEWYVAGIARETSNPSELLISWPRRNVGERSKL